MDTRAATRTKELIDALVADGIVSAADIERAYLRLKPIVESMLYYMLLRASPA